MVILIGKITTSSLDESGNVSLFGNLDVSGNIKALGKITTSSLDVSGNVGFIWKFRCIGKYKSFR